VKGFFVSTDPTNSSTLIDAVDGRNPAPADRYVIPLCTGLSYIPGGAGFQPSTVPTYSILSSFRDTRPGLFVFSNISNKKRIEFERLLRGANLSRIDSPGPSGKHHDYFHPEVLQQEIVLNNRLILNRLYRAV